MHGDFGSIAPLSCTTACHVSEPHGGLVRPDPMLRDDATGTLMTRSPFSSDEGPMPAAVWSDEPVSVAPI